MKRFVFAQDTDSVYIELDAIIKHMKSQGIEINDDNKIDIILKIAAKFQEGSNYALVDVSKKLFNIIKPHFFELKQEMVLESAYWSGKRRYAMKVINKEGVKPKEEDSFIMMGLDLVKSNFPKLFRDLGKSTIISILNKEPKQSIDRSIVIFKKSIKTVDWKQLLKPTGVKNIEEYIDEPPKEGNIFSTLKKKCPINTRACVYSNDLIRYHNIEVEFPLFKVGDKVLIAYLKENKYRINCIALKGYDDPPLLNNLVNEYIDRDKIFTSVIENKLNTLYSDVGWEFPNLNSNVSKFFKI